MGCKSNDELQFLFLSYFILEMLSYPYAAIFTII